MPDLLFELCTEEIPASYLPPAIEQLKREAAERFRSLGFSPKSILATATPRRLVLFVEELPLAQAGRTEEIAGPPEKAAFRDGAPTQAAKGFAEKNGVRVEDLAVKDTPKGRYVFAVKKVEGRSTVDLLGGLLPELVRALSFPKSMRWPQAPGWTFARPIRRVLALFGREVVPLELAGVRAGRSITGHPFVLSEKALDPAEAAVPVIGAPGEGAGGGATLELDRADYAEYRTLLKSHGVIVDRNERRAMIERALSEVFAAHDAPFAHHALLEEVTDLVELPEVVLGRFDERYLSLPREVVEAAMMDHQRYFPLVSKDGVIRPAFAFVANRPKRTADLVRLGNERVLRARLEDASFYLREDRKRPLAERVESLQGIVFQEKLGTMLQKTERLERLAGEIATLLWWDDGATKAAAVRAAHLAKADLTTELVKEFPELQGGIGAKYAALEGESPEVAEAIREQYLPRFAGDELPRTRAGIALSLAEKHDNIAGFFSIGLTPTGSADPYALRRQAAGIVRIFLERALPEGEARMVALACEPFAPKGAAPPGYKGVFDVVMFFSEREHQSFLDQGYRYDIINAVISAAGAESHILDHKRRLDAVTALSKEPFFQELVELVERTFNISKALEGEPKVDPALLREPEEIALFEAWQGSRDAIAATIAKHDYAGAAKLYLEVLGKPVHAFFAKVFVNVDDQAVRRSRLSLLREINEIFSKRVANLAKIVEGKK